MKEISGEKNLQHYQEAGLEIARVNAPLTVTLTSPTVITLNDDRSYFKKKNITTK